MEHYHITLDKEHYTKEEVEDLIHMTRCNMINEEIIRKAKIEKDFSESLAAQL